MRPTTHKATTRGAGGQEKGFAKEMESPEPFQSRNSQKQKEKGDMSAGNEIKETWQGEKPKNLNTIVSFKMLKIIAIQ